MLRHLLAGESHGPALVGILEGFPAGLRIKKSLVDGELALRQQGYGRGPRVQSIEKDQVTFLSGFWQGRTLGSPIAFQIPNLDYQLRRKRGIKAQRWQVPRPGHADLPGVTRSSASRCFRTRAAWAVSRPWKRNPPWPACAASAGAAPCAAWRRRGRRTWSV
ncbi:hypothetical protein CSB20_02065 [bacterium DOLZORAL124_64_63]|nr:MAG: hypothetical protein CSB20_02065 [bacterium DOLZORAL124_64_63]